MSPRKLMHVRCVLCIEYYCSLPKLKQFDAYNQKLQNVHIHHSALLCMFLVLLMWFFHGFQMWYVAKCNLGKGNLESMSVSSHWTHLAGCDPKPFAGAPCDHRMQSLACSHSQRVIRSASLLSSFSLPFFPSPPSPLYIFGFW